MLTLAEYPLLALTSLKYRLVWVYHHERQEEGVTGPMAGGGDPDVVATRGERP